MQCTMFILFLQSRQKRGENVPDRPYSVSRIPAYSIYPTVSSANLTQGSLVRWRLVRWRGSLVT